MKSTLTGKAWKALEGKDYDSVMGYTQKCIDMFKDKAVEMQKGLTAEPDTSDKAKVFANWTKPSFGSDSWLFSTSQTVIAAPASVCQLCTVATPLV